MKCLLCINLIVIVLCFVLPRIVQAIMFFSSWKTDGREFKWFRVALEKYNCEKTRPEAFFMFQLKFKNNDVHPFHEFFTAKKFIDEVKK